MAPDAQDASSDVTVLGPDQEVIASREVFAGSSIEIEDVPFGWVSIDAVGRCTVENELSLESPTMRLIIDEQDCTLTD